MLNKLLFICYKFLKVVYNSLYFYYFPLSVMFITIIVPQAYNFATVA